MFDQLLSQKKIYDISPLISENTAVFPGDTSFSRSLDLSFEKGNNFLLSSFKTTAHLAAHTDAPNHYHPQGKGIDTRDLSFYIGECQVIEVKLSPKERINLEHIKGKKIKANRVLFKTNSFPNSEIWNGDFNSLSPEVINHLNNQGVRLVGIDTPSIDPSDDKDLPSHQAIYHNDMAILEGIDLQKVEEGHYILIALPLRIKDADASPVRAILIEK